MKKNGFTLIELLGVIIILASLILLVFPSIINQIKSSNNSIENNVSVLVKNATELHINNNLDKYVKSSKNSYCISISDLVTEDYLNKEIVESSKNIKLDWKVKVNKYNKDTDKFSYSISDSCEEEYVCSLLDENNDGKINLSDIVTCGLERFYVMSSDNNKVTMLSEYRIRNIDNDMKQDKNETSKDEAGLEIFSTVPYWLQPDTDNQYSCYGKNYSNVLSKYKPAGNSEYPYVFDKKVESENQNNSDTVVSRVIKYNRYLKKIGVATATTTLMSYEQAIDLGCRFPYNLETNSGTCEFAPEWVYSTTYFLGSYSCVKSDDGEIRLWSIDSNTTFDRPTYNRGQKYHGVRPVVIISKYEIKI